MNFELKDILTAVGPSASIVFAAWIFMGYLQQRYTAAFDRYRSLIEQCRGGIEQEGRRGNVRDQVMLYRRRFALMRLATTLGLSAAILLISTLILGAVNVLLPHLGLLKYIGAACMIGGLGLVVIAAALVIRENVIIRRAVDGELMDVPELAAALGQQAGVIDDPRRGRAVAAE
ncbi:DUF2721 domain-containing protein [Paracraurococcus lichenis]|uniref:DUF2721 domain-containing protein n=1 Tax=Paracraurococcus lichenis TaxID=3064888 RepID=A0ABT9E1M4_9PROT|nr:DUF2721 domain-containing protein [Paracraurococcus sp. LOR1-02]MDO9709920.1 DUF2721 domain-containing protein [Paracraurococcus sp. LOR1-02]